jgi:hypothetical protein
VVPASQRHLAQRRQWRQLDRGQLAAPVSNFGFVTAVHPQDGETAWFVPAEADSQRIPPQAALAVTRTTDGGSSFRLARRPAA